MFVRDLINYAAEYQIYFSRENVQVTVLSLDKDVIKSTNNRSNNFFERETKRQIKDMGPHLHSLEELAFLLIKTPKENKITKKPLMRQVTSLQSLLLPVSGTIYQPQSTQLFPRQPAP